MSNPWFRMYSEFATDPKVQMLPEAMQRRLLMIMCMRCSNSLVTLQEQEIAFQLRITDAELAETKTLFISKKFIDKSWNVLNWEKRQFASDTSKARVAKHRLLQKEKQIEQSNTDVTLQKRNDNALEQNRTEQIQSNTAGKPSDLFAGFASFWETWPTNDRKQAKGKCLDAWKKASAERDAALVIAHVSSMKNSREWTKNSGEFIPAPLVYLNQRRWEGAEVSQLPAGGMLAGAI